ncbi:ankyrin repeat domain-containing protein [Stakelama sp. CBK3Z-3]|uniref:Ankyrin repeat domain-containing protein n=1 Tax=Stakelama flava TaxID=2860338 RepID=A0ABS6XMU3_9SPHN|nr:ankyrin repeat domain-containing protein [Stakelama flava]MBW4330736.1 ankyrin repeat domain-containing protein [Stakelama flava]
MFARNSAIFAASLALIAAPHASAQNFSEGYKFLKAVRDSDGNTVTSIVNQPGQRIINTTDPKSGDTALHIVTRRGDSTYLQFLLAKGADPDIRNDSGDSPALIAVQTGFVRGLELLSSANANFNLADRSGQTPLIMAVQMKTVPVPIRLKMIDILLKGGADPDQTDNIAGMSARDYAKRETRSPALLDAIEKGPDRGDAGAMYGPQP